MAIDIGPKIGIQGEAQFRSELRSINTGIKTLGSEMKAVTSEFIGQEKSVEALSAQNDVLRRTALSLNEKLELQKQMLQQCAEAYGEADEKTQKWQQAVNNTTADLNKANAKIKENDDAIEALGNEEETTGGLTNLFKGSLDQLGISMNALTMAGVVGLVVAAVKTLADAFSAAVTDSAAYADNINTLSTNFGIAKEDLQEYQYMAELTDTSVSTITGSISKLTRTMDAARSGNEEAAAAFEKLGIQIVGSDGKLRNADDVFKEVIDHLGYIEDGTERDALTMDLFGKSAMELNSLIAVGADGMKAFADEAHAMGYVLSDEDLAALNSVQDEFDRLDNMMTAVKNQIGAEMAPALVDLARELLKVAQQVDWRQFGQDAATVIQALTPLITGFAEAIVGLVGAFAELITMLNSGNKKSGGLLKFAAGAMGPLIPGLAEGGVIAPNNPGLYVLGDNPTEREIVAPRSEMVNATMEALRMSGGGTNVTIKFTGDLAQLGRVLQPVVTADKARIGAVI